MSARPSPGTRGRRRSSLYKLFLIDRYVTSADDHCQSKPEGPGSQLEGPPEDFFGFILNDSFSWWALTASAEVLRPNSDAISVLGIFWAMRFSLAMSTSVHGRISRWGIVVSSNARVTRSNFCLIFPMTTCSTVTIGMQAPLGVSPEAPPGAGKQKAQAPGQR